MRDHIDGILAKIREPLALDRWEIKTAVEAIPDARAYCLASPEYRSADIRFDLDKLETGDDVAEITVHEASHCHTWPLHALAEELAKVVGSDNEPLKAMLMEQVRLAGEQVTTDVGHTYLRLLRRAGVLDTPASDG